MEEHHIKGTIKVFGSPAEETLISRPYMVRAGLFNDLDAVINRFRKEMEQHYVEE